MTTTKASETKLAALYVRVSSADQSEKYSLPSQLAALKEKAKREGYTVRPDHVFTDVFSGKQASRPAFDKLNALVATGAVAAVLVYSVDRLARRTLDALVVARDYKRHGVKLDFIEASFEDTATGRFTFTQLASFAELWGEKILADSARGRKQKLEGGKLTSGVAAFGYVYVDKKQPNGARLDLDLRPIDEKGTTRVDIVRDIFRWRLEGMSLYGIARRLTDAGIVSKGRNGLPGAVGWSKQVVQQMLRNSTYFGQHKCSGIIVPVPAIIDEAAFQKVQQMGEVDYRRLCGRPSNKYLLRGFLFCARCTRRCITNPGARPSGKHSPFYRCGNITYKPYVRNCDAPGVNMTAIEAAAWGAVWSLLKDPALLMKLGLAYYDSLSKPSTGGDLEGEAAKLQAKIERTRLMVQDSLIDYAKAKADIRECEGRIRQIEVELSAAGRVLTLPPAKAVEAALREIATAPEPSTYERRRAVLERILDLRMEYLDRDLTIEGRVPIPAALGKGQKNRHSCVDGIDDTFTAVPFRLTLKVA